MAPDPRKVAPFYSALLSWDIANGASKMPNGSEYHMIDRPDGNPAGGVLTLTSDMQRGGARPGWLPYFDVDDVDGAVAKAAKLDGHATMPAQTIPDVGRIAMLADPKGAPFYLIKPTPPPERQNETSDVFDAEKAGHCRWNELLTNNATAAKSFYKDLLGWKIDDKMSMGKDGDYLFLDCAQERIGAISPTTAPAARPCWLPYFGVEDVERSSAMVTTNGGKLVRDLTEIPGDEYSFVATDPSGALVGFCGPKKS
jgi:predicted enzyme related to lactoylglutathione lyase